MPDGGTLSGARASTRGATAPSCASASACSSRRAGCRTSCGSREALDLYASFYRDRPTGRLLATLGLTEQREHRFDKLSGGQKQRLSIALALIGSPRVAVLDELTTGLDPQARRETWELIEDVRDAGVTVLLVTHFMEEAERLCDRIAVIDAGRVVALDTPAGLVAGVTTSSASGSGRRRRSDARRARGAARGPLGRAPRRALVVTGAATCCTP